ncbi:unnamed protein product [Arabis nemorensis]|uniref:Uncharacterized protein n=1 Tax=Arabis nemorensis TaxID=586526 RepID=A0A565BU60_9BRAS|nr:unnamed protein product [Arabis nemorensis]
MGEKIVCISLPSAGLWTAFAEVVLKLCTVQGTEFTGSKDLALSGYSVFIDPDSSSMVSELYIPSLTAASVQRYLGHSSDLVSPLWIHKMLEEKPTQTLVRMSADLARDLRTMLENLMKESCRECVPQDASMLAKRTTTCKERQKIVESAKKAVTNRDAKALHLFLCFVLSNGAFCKPHFC